MKGYHISNKNHSSIALSNPSFLFRKLFKFTYRSIATRHLKMVEAKIYCGDTVYTSRRLQAAHPIFCSTSAVWQVYFALSEDWSFLEVYTQYSSTFCA
jgi:hypothetical protein